jgi:hypothetical protein
LFVANSHQRKPKKRVNKRASGERLWFIAEHPLLASGVGAMFAIGIGAELTGASNLAALFYLAALAVLVVVFIRADLFRVSPQKAWIILSLSTLSLIVLWVAIRPDPPPSTTELARAIARELPTDRSSSGSASVPNASISPTKESTPEPRAFLDFEPEKLCAFFDKYNFAQAQDLIKPYLGKWMDADGTVLEVRHETFYPSAGDPSKMGITVWIESTRIYKGTGIAVFAMFDDPQGIERAKVLQNKERIKVRGQIQSVRSHLFSLQHSEIIE